MNVFKATYSVFNVTYSKMLSYTYAIHACVCVCVLIVCASDRKHADISHQYRIRVCDCKRGCVCLPVCILCPSLSLSPSLSLFVCPLHGMCVGLRFRIQDLGSVCVERVRLRDMHKNK